METSKWKWGVLVTALTFGIQVFGQDPDAKKAEAARRQERTTLRGPNLKTVSILARAPRTPALPTIVPSFLIYSQAPGSEAAAKGCRGSSVYSYPLPNTDPKAYPREETKILDAPCVISLEVVGTGLVVHTRKEKEEKNEFFLFESLKKPEVKNFLKDLIGDLDTDLGARVSFLAAQMVRDEKAKFAKKFPRTILTATNGGKLFTIVTPTDDKDGFRFLDVIDIGAKSFPSDSPITWKPGAISAMPISSIRSSETGELWIAWTGSRRAMGRITSLKILEETEGKNGRSFGGEELNEADWDTLDTKSWSIRRPAFITPLAHGIVVAESSNELTWDIPYVAYIDPVELKVYRLPHLSGATRIISGLTALDKGLVVAEGRPARVFWVGTESATLKGATFEDLKRE